METMQNKQTNKQTKTTRCVLVMEVQPTLISPSTQSCYPWCHAPEQWGSLPCRRTSWRRLALLDAPWKHLPLEDQKPENKRTRQLSVLQSGSQGLLTGSWLVSILYLHIVRNSSEMIAHLFIKNTSSGNGKYGVYTYHSKQGHITTSQGSRV